MQNVTLGVVAYELTRSAGFVAILGFAQLGPLLLLAMVGGALADVVDRRRLLVACQVEQLLMSIVLAWIAAADDPSKVLLVGCVLAIGVGNAINAPALSSLLPMLVGDRRDMPGAVSLQSVQMNASRVVGPAIAGLILPVVEPSGIFLINAATYPFVIAAVLVAAPRGRPERGDESGWRRLAGGLRVARQNRLVRQCLLTIAAISFFCLPFIGLMPAIAAENLDIQPDSSAYGFLYACFGLGAASGAISVGTVLAGSDKAKVVKRGLLAFSVLLAGFAVLRSGSLGYPLVLAVGVAYFTTVTSLSTVLQAELDDRVRGRVMALWIMGFGGTVPVGLLVGGAIADRAGVTPVVLFGAATALVLAALSDLRPRPAPRTAPGTAPVPR